MIASAVQLGLVKGASEQRGFSLMAGRGRAMFRVGSAPECNWRVTGPDVAPHHLMLLWANGLLSVVNVGAGNLYVDEQPFRFCREVYEGRILFGAAEILVTRVAPLP